MNCFRAFYRTIVTIALFTLGLCPTMSGQGFVRAAFDESGILRRWYVRNLDSTDNIVTHNLHTDGKTVNRESLNPQVRGKVKTISQINVNYDTVESNVCYLSFLYGKETYKMLEWMVFGPDTLLYYFDETGKQKSVSLHSKRVYAYREGQKEPRGLCPVGPRKMEQEPIDRLFMIDKEGQMNEYCHLQKVPQTGNDLDAPLANYREMPSGEIRVNYDSLGREVRTRPYAEGGLGEMYFGVPGGVTGGIINRIEKTVTSFDASGNICYRGYFLSLKSDAPELETLWKYEYDEVGNWVRCDYYENGRLMRHIEREIVYQ